MLTIIQGNDTTVSVLLHSQSLTLPDNEGKSYVERSKIDLSRAKDISVRLIPYMRWRPITPTFEVKGSTISIHYPASIQLVGKWDVEITFLSPDGSGYRQNRVRQSFADVIACAKGANSSEAYVITADVAQAVQGAKGDPGDEGDPGKSSYELAQEEEGFTGTKQEYLKSLHGAPGKDLYQAAVERGYKGSFDDFLEKQKGAPGAPGKSNYERAKELDGFQGTEVEYLASLHGAPGEGIYKMAVRKGFVGSEEDYLKSQKGKDGKSIYQLYLETTTDNPKLTEAQYAAINSITTQYLYRINKGKDAPMNEQTLSADQLMELDSHRRNIINALRQKGVQVSDDDGLETLEVKIGELKTYVPIIFKGKQFMDWKNTSFPTMRLSESYRPADLSYCFAQNPYLTKLPKVMGIENVDSISNLANGCSSLTTVSLPDLPTVKSVDGAFSSCSSLVAATIGNLPKVTLLRSLFISCQSMETATIGSAPKADNTNQMFYNCALLKRVSLDLSGGEITSADYMFSGCSSLRVVTGVIDITKSQRIGAMFSGCSSLEEVHVKGLKTDIDLSACVNLSTESVKYLVDNLQQTAGKSISLPRSWQQEHETEAIDNAKAASKKGFTLNFR